mgnify:CR=1 FL=1|jgi:hypothetical protein
MGGMKKRVLEIFYRIVACGVLPRRLFIADLPNIDRSQEASVPDRPLRLEIVSHCWRYSPVLTYQLSSLVLHPPREIDVQMTVFYSPEDTDTEKLLKAFGDRDVPHVTWNWQPIEKHELFRRCIGRNRAALATGADWIWFADCDVVFHEGSLDSAGRVLKEQTADLVFPQHHGVTPMLKPDDPIFETARERSSDDTALLLDIRPETFEPEFRAKAVGAFQILRGPVARVMGYCRSVDFYQQPVPRWQKTYEDRMFRWLLGTHGTPVEIPGIYRIRHIVKGRKTG